MLVELPERPRALQRYPDHHPSFDLYRDTSLIRKRTPLGPYSRNVPRDLRWSWGGGN